MPPTLVKLALIVPVPATVLRCLHKGVACDRAIHLQHAMIDVSVAGVAIGSQVDVVFPCQSSLSDPPCSPSCSPSWIALAKAVVVSLLPTVRFFLPRKMFPSPSIEPTADAPIGVVVKAHEAYVDGAVTEHLNPRRASSGLIGEENCSTSTTVYSSVPNKSSRRGG